MPAPVPHDLLERLATEDPLGLGEVRWRAHRLEGRRFSSIWILDPGPARERMRESAGGDELVLKMYRVAHPERRRKEFDDLERVFRALGPGSGVVRPVACWADRGAVLTLRAGGVPFAALIRAALRRFAPAESLARAAALCTQAGSWLRVFQTAGRDAVRGQQSQHLDGPAAFLEYVDERLRLQRRLRPQLRPDLYARLVAHAASALHAVPAGTWADVTWSHSDFGPHNILADGDRITVLDFELAPQHPYFDLAYFAESLANAAGPRADAASVRRLESAFFAGYGMPVDRSLLALFRLRHLVCAFVSEAKRRGFDQVRALPGLLVLRDRLRRLPADLSARAAPRAA
jgi:hypothetical protein